MSSTTYAKRTQYKPIDFFFRGVYDAKTKKAAFVDAFQILNDRYLGRMSVCNYFFIAENSVRINELNIIALEELKNYHLVMCSNLHIPLKTVYSLPITTRFLESDRDFEVLLATLKENGYKKGSIVLSFYCNTLVRIDEDARKRFERLRRAGYKLCVTGFGDEFNSLDVFADFNFDYLRCEAQYFDAAPNKKKLLAMLVKFCNTNKIGFIIEGVDAPAQYARYKREGVKLLTGKAVGKLGRWVTNELLGESEPADAQLEKYLAQLKKLLDAAAVKEQAELDALRRAAIEKSKVEQGGRILPSAPRPELAKSPYQVRLEQQKQAAKKAAEDRAQQQTDNTGNASRHGRDEYQQERLMREMSPLRFEGDIQSALALGAAAKERNINLGIDTKPTDIDKDEKTIRAAEKPDKSAQDTKTEKTQESLDSIDASESGIVAPLRPQQPIQSEPKKRKKIKPDFEKEEKLFKEFRHDSFSDSLGMSSGMRGFGVTLHIANENKDEEDLIGYYNERGQWVDEDGNTYNGYFDVEGKWVEYEEFDSRREGHYNDEAQWVDKDGNVYDGYFDEQGRWIDYTYIDKDGEIVDNGYFDDSIGKWVPFGYFDEQGTYRKL